ncbi:MAG: hypothetical protein D6708_02915 [Candidatus Dadabacteria bacterium]|nr:MAG: hypothetical protein D6708_02915 [Candidatus Dadabacteria bacterium]
MGTADLLALAAGYAAALWGGDRFVAGVLGRVVPPGSAPEIEQFRARGLPQGGRIIGYLERFLTVSFVLLGTPAAIGLVLAAKGILRFGEIREAKDQRVAEYVLIGTMLSLSWALAVGGLLRRWVLP